LAQQEQQYLIIEKNKEEEQKRLLEEFEQESQEMRLVFLINAKNPSIFPISSLWLNNNEIIWVVKVKEEIKGGLKLIKYHSDFCLSEIWQNKLKYLLIGLFNVTFQPCRFLRLIEILCLYAGAEVFVT